MADDIRGHVEKIKGGVRQMLTSNPMTGPAIAIKKGYEAVSDKGSEVVKRAGERLGRMMGRSAVQAPDARAKTRATARTSDVSLPGKRAKRKAPARGRR